MEVFKIQCSRSTNTVQILKVTPSGILQRTRGEIFGWVLEGFPGKYQNKIIAESQNRTPHEILEILLKKNSKRNSGGTPERTPRGTSEKIYEGVQVGEFS